MVELEAPYTPVAARYPDLQRFGAHARILPTPALWNGVPLGDELPCNQMRSRTS
jgi:hypothetical protein